MLLTLLERCIEVVASGVNPRFYKELPVSLKEKLLSRLSLLGLCSSAELENLIHPKICDLDLSRCHIPEKTLLLIGDLKYLVSLKLPEPPAVTSNEYSEATLVKVIKGKPDLLSLSMVGLRGVTDRVISVLVGGSPNLNILQLQNTSISSNALYCLANLSSLQNLNISRTEVTDVGLGHLCNGSTGPSLIELWAEGCARLTDRSFRMVQSQMEQLIIFRFSNHGNLDRSGLE